MHRPPPVRLKRRHWLLSTCTALAAVVLGTVLVQASDELPAPSPSPAAGAGLSATAAGNDVDGTTLVAGLLMAGQATGMAANGATGDAAEVAAFRARLLALLPGIQPDGHATAEIEASLAALSRSSLSAAERQQLLWELVLGSEQPAARRLLYDMIERVGSTFIADRIVQHFDAIGDPAERSRVLHLLARGLELPDRAAPDAASRVALERNTERMAELVSRLLATPGQAAPVLATAVDMLPDVAPAGQALQWLVEARRQGVLAEAQFYDATVRVVFSEAEQSGSHAVWLLQSLSRESDSVREQVNQKLFAFIAASSPAGATERPALEDYLRLQEAAMLPRATTMSAPEWVTAHHALLQAKGGVAGRLPDLTHSGDLDIVARATLVHAQPDRLAALDTQRLAALRQDLAAAAAVPKVGVPAAVAASLADAAALVGDALQGRPGRNTPPGPGR